MLKRGERGRETVRLGAEDLNTGGKPAAQSNVVKAQLGVILILAAVYFLQAATPFRLHPDTIVLFSVAETAAHGGGFLYRGKPTVYPPGYPALLAILIRLNLAHVWVIVGINIIFLTIGLLAVRHIFESKLFSEQFVLGVCILSLLSFIFIIYSAIPLTDTLFFGVSMCCLAVMNKLASSHFSLRRVIVSVVLVTASVCVRRIGIALIPALLYMLIVQSDLRLYIMRLSVRMKAAAILVAASVGVAVAWVVRTTSTLRDFNNAPRGQTAIDSLLGILTFRLKELGEIVLNVPSGALPPIVQDILPFIGALAFALVFGGIVSRRKQFGVVEAYVISYVAVILVWPFYDPRFWLPVIPFLIAYSGLSLRRLMQRESVARQIVRGYVLMFVVIGLVTLASNTTMSLSGSRFADVYPEYHSTYCAAWHCKEGFDAAKVDADGLHLLRSYK